MYLQNLNTRIDENLSCRQMKMHKTAMVLRRFDFFSTENQQEKSGTCRIRKEKINPLPASLSHAHVDVLYVEVFAAQWQCLRIFNRIL